MSSSRLAGPLSTTAQLIFPVHVGLKPLLLTFYALLISRACCLPTKAHATVVPRRGVANRVDFLLMRSHFQTKCSGGVLAPRPLTGRHARDVERSCDARGGGLHSSRSMPRTRRCATQTE